MEQFLYTVTEEMEDVRVDKALSVLIDSLSRSYIQKLCKDGKLYVNDKPEKGSYRLCLDDYVSFEIPDSEALDIKAEDIPLDVLYEDSDVIVVNKPKNMVVHPAVGHYTNTLVNALLFHCKDGLSGINGVLRPGIVHRIDKDTTGSVIACKNDFAHNLISGQLKEHSVNRKYLALCHGKFKETEGTVDAPIGRSENDRKKMAVNHKNGKEAVTHYKVLFTNDKYSLIVCKLETGRTHQIRVHMASIGHPLLGDMVYSNRREEYNTNGQALHAFLLGFKHPRTGEYVETFAPVPEYFKELVKKIFGENIPDLT